MKKRYQIVLDLAPELTEHDAEGQLQRVYAHLDPRWVSDGRICTIENAKPMQRPTRAVSTTLHFSPADLAELHTALEHRLGDHVRTGWRDYEEPERNAIHATLEGMLHRVREHYDGWKPAAPVAGADTTWKCIACGYENPSTSACARCKLHDALRVTPATMEKAGLGKSAMAHAQGQTWSCHRCGLVNAADANECISCKAWSASVTPPSPPIPAADVERHDTLPSPAETVAALRSIAALGKCTPEKCLGAPVQWPIGFVCSACGKAWAFPDAQQAANQAVSEALNLAKEKPWKVDRHFCCSPDCPGYVYRASEIAHPMSTCAVLGRYEQ